LSIICKDCFNIVYYGEYQSLQKKQQEELFIAMGSHTWQDKYAIFSLYKIISRYYEETVNA